LILPAERCDRTEDSFQTDLADSNVLMLGAETEDGLAGLIRASCRETAAGRVHAPRRSVLTTNWWWWGRRSGVAALGGR
jgi:hypothetical protein